MALPVEQAKNLAKSMAKSGLSGSISMAEPLGSDEEDGKDGQDGEDGVLKEICGDVVDAITSGDKEAACKYLLELVDRMVGHESSESPEEESSEPSY